MENNNVIIKDYLAVEPSITDLNSDSTRVVNGVKALIRNNDHFILQREFNVIHQRFIIKLFGGFVERNEEPFQALRREIQEELGGGFCLKNSTPLGYVINEPGLLSGLNMLTLIDISIDHGSIDDLSSSEGQILLLPAKDIRKLVQLESCSPDVIAAFSRLPF